MAGGKGREFAGGVGRALIAPSDPAPLPRARNTGFAIAGPMPAMGIRHYLRHGGTGAKRLPIQSAKARALAAWPLAEGMTT